MNEWDVVDNPAYASRAKRTVVTKAQRLFSSAVYAAERADREGLPITVDTLRLMNTELTGAFLADLLPTEKFQHALETRGIRLPSQTGLSPQQLAAAAIYMDMTTPMNHAQKLRAAGVTDAQWRGWMRQPRFAEHMSAISEDLLRASAPVALQRLADMVDKSNLGAIALQLEISGRHDRRKEGLDINQVLLAMFTILDEEISPLPGGVGVLERINEKVKRMMGVGQAPVLQISPVRPPADS